MRCGAVRGAAARRGAARRRDTMRRCFVARTDCALTAACHIYHGLAANRLYEFSFANSTTTLYCRHKNYSSPFLFFLFFLYKRLLFCVDKICYLLCFKTNFPHRFHESVYL